MVERITITIKKDLLRKIDSMVDKHDIRNRSHAVEKLIAKSLNKSGVTTALIMAGEGSRTHEVPKPLIKVMGKTVLEHQINFLKMYGITNILIATDYTTDKLMQHFGNGRAYGVDIRYLTEERSMGTAGAISLAKDYIEGSFAMLNVDTIMSPNIYEMYEFHKEHKKLATVMLTTVADPSHFGVVKMRGSQITKFMEKPKPDSGTSRLINAGLCIFDQKIISMVPGRKIMIEELFRKLCKQGQLMGFVHSEPVFDVGTKEGYERITQQSKL